MFSRSILGEKNPMPTPMIHRAAGRELELAGPGARLRAEQAADIENETMKGRDFHFVRSGNKQFVGAPNENLDGRTRNDSNQKVKLFFKIMSHANKTLKN